MFLSPVKFSVLQQNSPWKTVVCLLSMFELCVFKCDHNHSVPVVRPEERTRSGLCFAAKHTIPEGSNNSPFIGANIDELYSVLRPNLLLPVIDSVFLRSSFCAPQDPSLSIHNICIPVLDWNGETIFIDIHPHEPPLQARSSPIPRMRLRSVV